MESLQAILSRVTALSMALLALSIFVLSDAGRCQTPSSSDGTDFYVGYLEPAARGANNLRVVALIGAYATDTVTVTAFTTSGVEVAFARVIMTPLTTAEVPLDPKTLFRATDLSPGFGSYHIHATSPISVQIYSDANNATELYLALPINILSTSYQVISYANRAPIVNDAEARSTFVVIATKDSTYVTVSPTCPTVAPVTGPILLQRGEVMRVRSQSGYQQDLTGTTVTSTYPVVVLAGHEGALLPDLSAEPDYQNKFDPLENLMIEQLRPISEWTQAEYFSIPFASVPPNSSVFQLDTGNLFRVVDGGDPTDSIHQRSTNGDSVALWSGAYAEYDDVQPASEIFGSTARPIDCMQYDYYRGKIAGDISHGYASPVMMDVIPRPYWKNEYLWRVPASSQYRSGQYLGIIYDRQAMPRITHNGSTLYLPPSTLSIPGHPELQFVTVKVQPGSYHATAAQPFIVYSYGRSENNYKINTAYAAPCGTGGVDNIGLIRLSIDSLCGSWTGVVTNTGPSYTHLSALAIFDSARAKKLHLRPSNNATLAYDSLSDSTWSFTVTVSNPLIGATINLYVTDPDGTRVLHSFQYTAPKLISVKALKLPRVLVSHDTCAEFDLVNGSPWPIKVDAATIVVRSNVFRMTGATLPALLKPGDTLRITLCAYTDIVDSTLSDTLQLSLDCITYRVPLTLSAIGPRVNWLSTDQERTLACGEPDTVRVWLVNDNMKDGQETIDDVVLAGPDAAEFHIVRNEFGYQPLRNFPMSPGEQMWIDVAFTPDMSKPEPMRWSDRTANLIARNSLHNDPTIHLRASMGRAMLAVDQNAIDLGTVSVGEQSSSAQLTISDTGNYPLVISSLSMSDNRIVLQGLSIGDTIYPGDARTITLTGSSATPDTINALLTLASSSACSDTERIQIRFITFEDPQSVPQAQASALDLPLQFTCLRTSAEAEFHNTGKTDITVSSIAILGDVNGAFTFVDGSRFIGASSSVKPGESLSTRIIAMPTIGGNSTAMLRYAWDSAGVTVSAYANLSVTATLATASAQVMPAVMPSGAAPSSEIEVPIEIVAPPPSALGSDAIEMTVQYRRDLFSFSGLASRFTADTLSRIDDANGYERIRIRVTSASGFATGGELVRLRFEIMLALDTASEIEITDCKFLNAMDTRCVSFSSTPYSFDPALICGDSLMRRVMAGRDPFAITSVAPNPADRSLLLRIHAAQATHVELTIEDILGEPTPKLQDRDLSRRLRTCLRRLWSRSWSIFSCGKQLRQGNPKKYTNFKVKPGILCFEAEVPFADLIHKVFHISRPLA